MLVSVKSMIGYRLKGTDAKLGAVQDLYFDDSLWTTQYLVADTGGWLSGRKVLIPRPVLGKPDWSDRLFHVDLTTEQIEKSPSIQEDEPVSRQREAELHSYLGLQPYWMRLPGGAHAVAVPPASVEEAQAREANENQGDPHLRSAREVMKYRIDAADGDIGHVDDFIVDVDNWMIRYLVVDTRNWLPGRKVLVAVSWIEDVTWEDATVKVNLRRGAIKDGPPYDPNAPINRQFEEILYDFHGRPHYWRSDTPNSMGG